MCVLIFLCMGGQARVRVSGEWFPVNEDLVEKSNLTLMTTCFHRR